MVTEVTEVSCGKGSYRLTQTIDTESYLDILVEDVQIGDIVAHVERHLSDAECPYYVTWYHVGRRNVDTPDEVFDTLATAMLAVRSYCGSRLAANGGRKKANG